MPSRSERTAPPVASPDEVRWRWALWGAFLVTVARLAWLGAGRTDLYPDEAQYWVWSLHPALGYYSKPPLVAWLIALTTGVFGDEELAVRLAAPLLHFGTALIVFQIARRLYDSRTALWSSLAYVTLPGVSVSAVIMSTDAPLLFCWAAALYFFIRAREPGGAPLPKPMVGQERFWWIAVGVAAGFGLLAKYAMAYWLFSALLFLVIFPQERRHLRHFLLSVAVALVIYAPNFVWNALEGFVSYRHTRDNAHLSGSFFHPDAFAQFLAAQFGVFGPIFFAVLILLVLRFRASFAERRAALLATFALPTLLMMLVVSFLSRAQPNWSAPTFVSAVILVVAWLLTHARRALVIASVALHVAAAVVIFLAHDVAVALGHPLPGKYDPIHRLRGWHQLGNAVGTLLLRHPGAILMSDDREDMAALLYYVRPHSAAYLKWNGEGGIHDQFDLEAHPERDVGRDFLLVTRHPDNIERILKRFAGTASIDHIMIPLGSGDARRYDAYLLKDFKGYLPAPSQ